MAKPRYTVTINGLVNYYTKINLFYILLLVIVQSCSSDVLFFVFHKHKVRSFSECGILTRTRGILTHTRGILTHMHGILTRMHGILTRMHGCLHCICMRTYKAAQAHTYIIHNGIRFGVLPPSLHPSPFTRLTPHNHLFGIFLRWYFIM